MDEDAAVRDERPEERGERLTADDGGVSDQEVAASEAREVHPESGGGARYQQAHRQHALERDAPKRSRAARGTADERGPDANRSGPLMPAGANARPEHRDGQPDAPGLSANEPPTHEPRVQPHPDDESWLKDLGYPKVGEHVESHATQIEHGPNAGGTQQGHADDEPTEPATSGANRHGARSS